MWDLGAVYELPTSAAATRETGTSSLLPTPTTPHGGTETMDTRSLRGSGTPDLRTTIEVLLPTPAASLPNDAESYETWEARRQRALDTHNNSNGMGTPLAIAVRMLPTPNARDGKGGWSGTDGVDLQSTVDKLMPTPTASDSKGSRRETARTPEWTSKADSVTLTDAVTMLPTPTARDWRGRNQRDDATCLPGAVGQMTASTGESTRPESDDGSTSTDAPPAQRTLWDV
jgi:hypothetical protein